MNNRIYLFTVFLVFASALAACSLPRVGETRPSPAEPGETQAVPTVPASTPDNTGETPVAVSDLLPNSFHFLGKDNAGLMQVFRIERDGTNQSQLTSEPVNVLDYDVSLADGSVAYLAKDQILLVSADGSNRRILVDATAEQGSNPVDLRYPVFSPDGQTLAYAYDGLNLYDLSSGASQLVFEDQWEDPGNGQRIPKEIYWPERYSPDGTKLLIRLVYLEGATPAIYVPASNALVRLISAEGGLICCAKAEWSSDSSNVIAVNPSPGVDASGLWSIDATTGTVTTLIPGFPDDRTANFFNEPYLAPDGQLYFFFANYDISSAFLDRPPLQPVRSAPDGVSGRTVLRPDTFELLNEALWAPDASFVIVAFAPIQDVYDGGQAEVVYLDGRPNVVLTTFAQKMKWGP